MKTHLIAAVAALLLSMPVMVLPAPRATAASPTRIELPAAGARTTLPLHILARVGRPGEVITATLRWQNGTYLWQTFTTLRGRDGGGLLVASLDHQVIIPDIAHPATQPATLELRNRVGVVLARQRLTILRPSDPATQRITVYFVANDRVVPRVQWIPRTTHPARAALEELLWGPHSAMGTVTTALPLPQQVLTYPGRPPDWGVRVTLRQVTIVNGVATADFSQELAAYGGGSTRVRLIRQQVTATLRQFPTVHQVRIAIDGQTDGVLEP